jgi:Flp pilus assembly protein TadB
MDERDLTMETPANEMSAAAEIPATVKDSLQVRQDSERRAFLKFTAFLIASCIATGIAGLVHPLLAVAVLFACMLALCRFAESFRK